MWKLIPIFLLISCRAEVEREESIAQKVELQGGFSENPRPIAVSQIDVYVRLLERARAEGDQEAVEYFAEKLAWLLIAASEVSKNDDRREILDSIRNLPEWVGGVPIQNHVMFFDEFEIAFSELLGEEILIEEDTSFGSRRIPSLVEDDSRIFSGILRVAIRKLSD